MAFLQNGTWIPDQPINAMPQINSPSMAGMPSGIPIMSPIGIPQVAQQGTKLMSMPQANMSMPPVGVSTIPMNLGITPQNSAPIAPPISSQAPMQTQNQGGNLPSGPPQPQNVMPQPTPPIYDQSSQLGGGGYGGYTNMAPQSVMQSVNNANPQSVQNFLKALQQTPSANQGNAWQNPQGVQGQGPQAGFRGFQQNGIPTQGTNWQGYTPSQGPQLGSYANQATQGYSPPQQSQPQAASPSPTPLAYAGRPPSVANETPAQSQHQPSPTQQPQSKPFPENTNQGGGYRKTFVNPSNNPNANASSNSNYAMAASDVQLKQNIEVGNPELQEFLNSLGVYSYEYTDPKYGEGRRISPMAQEIESTPLGQIAISENEEGYKIVDYGKLGGTMLASLALLNHKYNKLEDQLKKNISNNLAKRKKK